MQADSIFVLVLLAAFFGFVVLAAVRSRRKPSPTAEVRQGDSANPSQT